MGNVCGSPKIRDPAVNVGHCHRSVMSRRPSAAKHGPLEETNGNELKLRLMIKLDN